MKSKKVFAILAIVTFAFFSIPNVFSGDTMEVSVDVLSASGGDVISIEVPDELYFGEMSFFEKSDEFKVYVNNTGSVDITVTPRLTDNNEEIFDNLYFRKTKTRTVNGTSQPVPYTKIDNFEFDIAKPASGDTEKSAYFYVILDLTNYNGDTSRDVLNHASDVKFYAVAS